MWRHVNLGHLFLPLVPFVTLWCVVCAQSDPNGTSNAIPTKCIARRYWWTSMWGFIVTLVALTMDVWGITQPLDDSTMFQIFSAFFMSAFNPLVIIWRMLENALTGMEMLANLREALGDDVIAPIYPWSKSHIKIILGSKVVVNLSLDIYLENHNDYAFADGIEVENFSEALVIGTRVVNSSHYHVQLTNYGHLALLRSNVLPPYDELKFLRGYSSLDMAIVSTQAIGYIYGIVVRCVQGLRVSPIEAIACVLNMLILMKGILHNLSSFGYRPLLLYLPLEDQAKFIAECNNLCGFYFKGGRRLEVGVTISCGILLAVGAYFIINFLKSLSGMCVVPIILFEVTLVLGGIVELLPTDLSTNAFRNLTILLVMLNLVGYIWALVVTFKHWKGEAFDVQSSNYLSHVLPHIG